MSQPWVKFFPSDWMADPKVKLCSRETRSFWVDVLCLLWQSETGRLEVNSQPATDKQIAAMTGDNPRTVRKMMGELLDNGVCSLEDGFIINRRIIRDRIKAEKDRENGAKGGSPLLKNNDLRENEVNPQKPEARSQKPDKISDDKSSSASRTKSHDFPKPDFADDQVWSDFLKNRKTKKLTNTSTAHKRMLDDLAKVSAETGWPPGRVFEVCVAKGWGAIFNPVEKQGNGNGTGFNTNRPEPELNSVAQAALARRAERARGEQELF